MSLQKPMHYRYSPTSSSPSLAIKSHLPSSTSAPPATPRQPPLAVAPPYGRNGAIVSPVQSDILVLMVRLLLLLLRLMVAACLVDKLCLTLGRGQRGPGQGHCRGRHREGLGVTEGRMSVLDVEDPVVLGQLYVSGRHVRNNYGKAEVAEALLLLLLLEVVDSQLLLMLCRLLAWKG